VVFLERAEKAHRVLPAILFTMSQEVIPMEVGEAEYNSTCIDKAEYTVPKLVETYRGVPIYQEEEYLDGNLVVHFTYHTSLESFRWYGIGNLKSAIDNNLSKYLTSTKRLHKWKG
jgi:hypothetical protein